MVTIQCPHCEKDIELEDGLIGLFDCPYCEQQFSWETPSHSFMSTWFDLWFGLLIPSLTIFPGLPILLVIFDPQGLEALIYLAAGILLNILTAILLGLMGLRMKRRQLALGALFSPIASAITFFLYAETI
tara:strand:+ start:3169 stop:3558 length:390 start_codon:yes stop_codon:yes gene_type:complete